MVTLDTLRTRPPIRLVHAGDAAAMARFVDALDPDSRRLRFHGAVKASQRLARLMTEADGRAHVAWVACVTADDGAEVIVGEARYVCDARGGAEIAVSVALAWRGRGVADRLLGEMVAAARAAGVYRLVADVLADNARMLAFMRRKGFEVCIDFEADDAPDHVRLQCALDAPWRAGGRLRALAGAISRRWSNHAAAAVSAPA